MSPLLIPLLHQLLLLLATTATTVATTTVATTTVAITTVATTTVATTITTMSIVFVIFLIVVILLAIRAFNYVSIWWYREADHSEQDTFLRYLNTAKIQTIRSGFGQNHHLVSRLARETAADGWWTPSPGFKPFLASTYQSNLSPQYATIGRTVVHLPPPAVYLLPRPVPPSLAPEILAPIVVEPIQSLSVAVSHTPDRNPAKISGILNENERAEMMSAARPIKIRRIQEMPDLGCATEGRSHRGSTTTFQEIRKLAKIRRSRRVRFGGVPATPRRGAAMRTSLKTYTRGNQIRPDLLLTPRGRPSIDRLISFWDAPMVAMGISPPPEVYGNALSYITLTPCQAQNEPCQAMDISPPKFETDPIKPKTVSGLVSFWNAMSNDMSMDVAPIPTEYEKQHVPVMEWGLADFKEPISPMDMSSPDQSNDDELEHLWGCSNGSVGDYGKSTPEIPAVSSDNFFRIRTPESPESKNMDMDTSGFLGKESGVKRAVTTPDMPRQSVSPVEMDCSWADSVDRRSRITPPNPFFISEPSTWKRPQTPPQPNHGVSPMLSTAPPSHSFLLSQFPGPILSLSLASFHIMAGQLVLRMEQMLQ
ncbi:hypothetical protein BASA83_012460 [Batrachochytrium salamandrivorans]|nr:hypothetical protein BASA83_012460 [Batrachochytrium salamandrivorans]